MEVFKGHNPRHCCQYPTPRLTVNQTIECTNRCTDLDDKCCEHDCGFELSGVFVDGKLNKETLLKRYEYDLANYTITNDDWPQIIENAMETCENLSKKIFRVIDKDLRECPLRNHSKSQ